MRRNKPFRNQKQPKLTEKGLWNNSWVKNLSVRPPQKNPRPAVYQIGRSPGQAQLEQKTQMPKALVTDKRENRESLT